MQILHSGITIRVLSHETRCYMEPTSWSGNRPSLEEDEHRFLVGYKVKAVMSCVTKALTLNSPSSSTVVLLPEGKQHAFRASIYIP